MRSLILIIGFSVLLIGAIPVAQAQEHEGMMNPCGKEMKNPCGGGMMNPCMKEKMMNRHKMKKEFMNEGMGILLDTIILLKDSATDPKMKKRAAALETRMRTHLQKHDEMHKEMGKMHKKGGKGMMNPCGKKKMKH